MKITAITIFPDYFAPLQLSLIGKARQGGVIELGILNLRDFTTDSHHTVDDTPYGGGAGMVMKPEVWGDAIDSVLAEAVGIADLVILTPAGKKLLIQVRDSRTQAIASALETWSDKEKAEASEILHRIAHEINPKREKK